MMMSRKPWIIRHKKRIGKFIPFNTKPKHIHHHHHHKDQAPEKKQEPDPQLVLSFLGIALLVIAGVVFFAIAQPLLFACLIGAVGFGIWYFFFK
jgi:hypothetical protein